MGAAKGTPLSVRMTRAAVLFEGALEDGEGVELLRRGQGSHVNRYRLAKSLIVSG